MRFGCTGDSIEADPNRAPHLIGSDGEAIELPTSVIRVLNQTLDALKRDQVVVVNRMLRDLTIPEAASILNVSREYLAQLLDEGKLPSREVRERRRVSFDDLMSFKRQWDAERREALAELTRINEELGLYEWELRNAPPMRIYSRGNRTWSLRH